MLAIAAAVLLAAAPNPDARAGPKKTFQAR